MTDYYKILEIPKTAGSDEIKKAYRKLAMQWHPDKNPTNKEEAEEKFKKISEAYSILSDPEKKKQYDEFGVVEENSGMPPGFRTGGGGMRGVKVSFGGMGQANKIFEQFFSESGEDPFMHHFSGFGHPRMKPRKRIVNNELPCTLEELYAGCTKKLKVNDKILTIDIKQGWKEGTKITFDEDFDNMILIFIIKEKKHNSFTRIDNDLYCKLTISNKEALSGFKKSIDFFGGTKKTVDLKGINSSDYVHMIEGGGMPIRKDGSVSGFGNLYINFIVTFK